MVTFLFMAPFSQELEPPQSPGRFIPTVRLPRCRTFESACFLSWTQYLCFAFNLHLTLLIKKFGGHNYDAAGLLRAGPTNSSPQRPPD
ncbi:hypothetical protein BZM26_34250 [Paraburkholderia strydomiana]|nr:hypothetical protein BZM26_34250 [Paraburkholderia strydomiana]